MDIPIAMTDVYYVISTIDERQLNMNNLGHDWHSRAYDCQTLLDATGDSTNTLPQQCFHRIFTIPFITDLLSENNSPRALGFNIGINITKAK